MDRYTFETRCWLDLRFSPDVHRHFGGDYDPYQPLHGIAPGAWGPNQFLMVARLVRLVAGLDQLQPESFLDVGGAEGLIARMVADRYEIPGISVDLSVEAALRAREYCEVPAAAADSARLPFADDSFDVVFLSEVLEHLANPVRSLLECRRVARRAVVITTEAFAPDEAARQEELDERVLANHMDRSIFCPGDFAQVFAGWSLELSNQCSVMPDPLPADVDEAEALARDRLAETDIAWPAHGIVVFATKGVEAPAVPGDFETALAAVIPWFRPKTRQARALESLGGLPESLRERLAAPETGAALDRVEDEALIFRDGQRFALRSGAPDLVLPPETEFRDSLEERIARHEGLPKEGLVALAEKLRFDLPAPVTETQFLSRDADGWELGEGLTLTSSGSESGVQLHAAFDDPSLFSPRLRHPAAQIGGFALQVRIDAEERGEEEVQVFWHTLRRPVWWEGGCWSVAVPADGAWHQLEHRFAEGLPVPEDDELLQLRIDPRHRAGEVALRDFKILSR
jgi:SAM-dependent methyltransferase